VGKGLSRAELKQNLFIRCGTTTKLDVENSFQAFRADLLELKPDLVLIDSFATFHNSPENDRMAIQNVLNRIKALRDEVGCSFIFINHESKMVFQHVEDSKAPTAFDMLGSVGIVAAAEFCLTVRKIEPGTSMVHHTKSTLASASKSFTVALTDTDKGVILRGNI
jgi:RecA-family ATPase